MQRYLNYVAPAKDPMSSEVQNSLWPFFPYDCILNLSERLVRKKDYSPLELLASIATIAILIGFIVYPRLILLMK
jgi:hypothetical protein